MPTKVPGICVIVLFSKIAVTSCQSVTTRQHNLFSVYKAYLEIRSVDDDDTTINEIDKNIGCKLRRHQMRMTVYDGRFSQSTRLTMEIVELFVIT
jgi:hypothetical protein